LGKCRGCAILTQKRACEFISITLSAAKGSGGVDAERYATPSWGSTTASAGRRRTFRNASKPAGSLLISTLRTRSMPDLGYVVTVDFVDATEPKRRLVVVVSSTLINRYEFGHAV